MWGVLNETTRGPIGKVTLGAGPTEKRSGSKTGEEKSTCRVVIMEEEIAEGNEPR